MFELLKEKVQSKNIKGYSLPPIGGASPNLEDWVVYQNRYNNAVNFGSLFVLEKYIFDSLFKYGGNSEYEAISSLVKNEGTKNAASKLRAHYESYLSKVDWDWLANDASITCIRLPVGYWHVANGEFVEPFNFRSLVEVYRSAAPWNYVRDVLSEARKHKIGVLVDIHALPGGANSDSHGGSTGGAQFFKHNSYVKYVTKNIIPFIARDLVGFENLVGLQVVNEAAFDGEASANKKYYKDALAAVRQYSSSLPLVISDGWWTKQWEDWLQEEKLSTDIIIDTHIYRCFSESDKAKSAQKIISELAETVKFNRDAADHMVGEFSCVLDGETWNRTIGDRAALVKQYGKEQVRCFKEQASYGFFFWTYKFEYGDGGEWGFVPMTVQGCIERRSKKPVQVDENIIRDMINKHVNYWANKGGECMEHYRYEEGLRWTTNDILAFDRLNNSRIGRLHFWRSLRRAQYIEIRGDSDYMWEWEHGFSDAISAFNG